MTLESQSILFSYHRNHRELVLKISSYLKNGKLPPSINIEDGIDETLSQKYFIERKSPNKRDLFSMNVVVCFLTPMYQSSKHCEEQIRIAKTMKIPMIGVRILPNWKPSGWLNQITNDLSMIDFRGINQNNFDDKMNQFQEKLLHFLKPDTNPPAQSREISFDDQSTSFDELSKYPLIENSCKKKPIHYRILPSKCRLNLSNLIVCSNEYILIHGNNHLHLFDKNLRLIRSNKDIPIKSNDLKDLSWSEDSNHFLILTRLNIYLMNPLTCKLTNMKLKDQREEYICCTSSNETFFLIKSQINSKLFYLEEFYLTNFRFIRKYLINQLIGTSLCIQNGFFNLNSIQQITSIRIFQEKLIFILQNSSQWFIYVFNANEQRNFVTKIPLEDQSRMCICHSINQWIVFKDFLSNSFIQFSIDFYQKSPNYSLQNYSKAFIDFDGKLRSLASFGSNNLVFLLDQALVIYQLHT